MSNQSMIIPPSTFIILEGNQKIDPVNVPDFMVKTFGNLTAFFNSKNDEYLRYQAAVGIDEFVSLFYGEDVDDQSAICCLKATMLLRKHLGVMDDAEIFNGRNGFFWNDGSGQLYNSRIQLTTQYTCPDPYGDYFVELKRMCPYLDDINLSIVHENGVIGRILVRDGGYEVEKYEEASIRPVAGMTFNNPESIDPNVVEKINGIVGSAVKELRGDLLKIYEDTVKMNEERNNISFDDFDWA